MSSRENHKDNLAPRHPVEPVGRNGSVRKSGIWLSIAVRGQRSTYHATPGPLPVFLIILVLSMLFGAIVFALLGVALIWFLFTIIFVFVVAAVALLRITVQRPR